LLPLYLHILDGDIAFPNHAGCTKGLEVLWLNEQLEVLWLNERLEVLWLN
jgi:hypothetical protein